MYEHNISCKREAMCWLYNISDKFEVLKDLGGDTFQVFFTSDRSEAELRNDYGILLGWEPAGNKG